MKKGLFLILFTVLIVCSVFALAAPSAAAEGPGVNPILSFIPLLIIVAIIVVIVNLARKNKKPLSDIQNTSSGTSYGGYPLTNLTSKLFSVFFEIILWIILLGGIIGGAVIGDAIGSSFGGIILGGIVAFIIIILTGGLVSLFIKLVNNTDEIKKKIS